jgi:hypothetical protein
VARNKQQGLEAAPEYAGANLKGMDQSAMQAHQRMRDLHNCDHGPAQPMEPMGWPQMDKDFRAMRKLQHRNERGGSLFTSKDMTGE